MNVLSSQCENVLLFFNKYENKPNVFLLWNVLGEQIKKCEGVILAFGNNNRYFSILTLHFTLNVKIVVG